MAGYPTLKGVERQSTCVVHPPAFCLQRHLDREKLKARMLGFAFIAVI
jgi:hypothetical protein